MAQNRSTRPTSDLARARNIQTRPPLTPPRHLSTAAKRLWKIIQAKNPHLRRDHFSENLELYCTAVVRAREAQAILDREGLIIEGPRGPVAHPAAAVVTSATSSAARYSVALGLTPSSRKEHVSKEEERDPAFEEKPRPAHLRNLRLA